MSIKLKVQHIKRNQLDEDKWDVCVQTSSSPTVYALSWYLDCISPNWEALIIGDYSYVFPLPVKRKLRTIKYIGIPPFCQQLGAFSKQDITTEILTLFLEAIPGFYVRQDIALNYSNPLMKESIQRDNFVLFPDIDFRKGYSQQTKRNLKSASKHPLELLKNIDFQTIIELFISTKGKEIEKIDYNGLSNICEKAARKSMLRTVGAYVEGELVSGAIFIEFQQRWYMIMLASSQKGKECLASTIIIDEVLQQVVPDKKGIDFEGSSIPSLARFYSGFGAKNEPFQLFTKRIL